MLSYAFENTKNIPGSSTACILCLNGSKLISVNVGDSGFMVVRDGKVLFRSKEQLHNFNYPYQLGTASTTIPSDGDSITLGKLQFISKLTILKM